MENVIGNEKMVDSNFTLNSIEKDTIGEIMNISMGSAATAISTMLNRRVSITTPEVILTNINTYEFRVFEPAVCTEIKYLDGLNGSNFMIMKLVDVKSIVKILLNMEEEEEDSGLDEMYLSAIGEIMNQMMGSSSTSLASFFGHNINISIPEVYELEKIYDNVHKLTVGDAVIVKFRFKIEGVFDSEFLSILPIDFTKDIVSKALGTADGITHTEKPAEVKPPKVEVTQEKRPEVKKQPPVNVKPLKLNSFEDEITVHDKDYKNNDFNLLLDVPLEITVEIGRAKKLVKDILEIRQGNIIELDKQAGDAVDIIVNGQLLAKGDVVVVDDNFGVRITEIISNKEVSVN